MASNSRFRAARRIAAIGIVAALIGLASPAIADDLQKCHDESGDAAIAACTRAIGAGKLSKRNQAIRLEPKFAGALNNRGLARRLKGDTVGGDADIARAKQLDKR